MHTLAMIRCVTHDISGISVAVDGEVEECECPGDSQIEYSGEAFSPSGVDCSRLSGRFDFGTSLAGSCFRWWFRPCELPPLTLLVI